MILQGQLNSLKEGSGHNYPPIPHYPSHIKGVGIIDGVLSKQFIKETYEWLITKDNWGFSVYSTFGPNNTKNSPERFWGITIYAKHLGYRFINGKKIPNDIPFSITSLDISYLRIFDLAQHIIECIYKVPFDIYTIHLNGQTKAQKANIHCDSGENIIIMLTPDWKKEYDGNLKIYEIENQLDPHHTIDYKPGRFVFFNGLKGHGKAYWHNMSTLNDDPIWHAAEAPSLDCPLLRITLNIKGRAHYPGGEVHPRDIDGLRTQEHINARI